MSTGSSTHAPGSTGQLPARTGWYGWVAFAGVIMLMLGFFHVLAGLVALFEEDYFLVTQGGLVVDVDFTAWGWAHLIIGLVIGGSGWALFSGAWWARSVTVAVALMSSILNLAFMSAYPLWSAIMIAIDITVIYAVTAHGGPTAADGHTS